VTGLLSDLQALLEPERRLDLEIVAWGDLGVISHFTARAMTTVEYAAARSYVLGIIASGGTSFAAAVSRAPAFFAAAPAEARRLLFLLSDGGVGDFPDPTPTVAPAVATVRSIPGLAVHAFNIDRDGIMPSAPREGSGAVQPR
jgi:hypothetical protein